jgi:hypothetical protein
MTETSRYTQSVSKPGCVKVRLHYSTWAPRHIRSFDLASEFAVDGPYIEDVSVLLPAKEVFARKSAFEDTFRSLQLAGVVERGDRLTGFTITEEDVTTVAYLLED